MSTTESTQTKKIAAANRAGAVSAPCKTEVFTKKQTASEDAFATVAGSLSLDGKQYDFFADETILDVAKRNGVRIPVLCKMDRCRPTGACRMCLVEVEGARSLVASCAAPAGDGMVVQTDSARVIRSRKMNLELLLASGSHDCLLCTVSGECELQALAFRYNVSGKRFERSKPQYPPDTGNRFILRDFSKCILCGRCVQACKEIQVNNAIDFGYRGAKTKIVSAGDLPLGEGDCVFCGECVQQCPVGALTARDSRTKPRITETDRIRSTCGYCGVGCQVDLHVKDGRVVSVSGADVAPNHGSLCVKGRFGYSFIHSAERLTSPLVRKHGELVPVSWDEALAFVADALGNTIAQHGPDAVGVLASARCTNEENYLLQKFARTVVGTNNIDHCARH